MTEPGKQPVVWVTGAGGLIGNCLIQSPRRPTGWRIVGLTRPEVDLLDAVAVEKRFNTDSPALVIHCAALSTAAACAKSPALARQLNVETTRHLAGLCRNRSRLVLLSTDLVFDGRKGGYAESDPVNPLNLYGETKVEAESLTLAHAANTVIRTSLNAGISPTGDRSFAELTRAAWRRGETLTLFTDEFRNPIGADVTARAIWELATGCSSRSAEHPSARAAHEPAEQCSALQDGARGGDELSAGPLLEASEANGILHVAGSERLNRLQIGQMLAACWPDLNARIEAASLRGYRGGPRPPDCTLDCAKAQALLSFPLPRFSDWLRTGPLATP